MISVVCWLWSGPRGYKPSHVNALRKMVAKHLKAAHRFICVTDETQGFDKGIELVKTPPEAAALGAIQSPEGKAFPSCYRRLWMFSDAAKCLGERVLLLDVDLVVTGNLAPLLKPKASFVGWRPLVSWGNQKRVAGGIYLLTTGAHTEVWDDFSTDGIALARDAGYRGSDQAWISYKLGKTDTAWPQDCGIYALSDFSGGLAGELPAGTRLVQFSGNVKPWDIPHDWVRDHYPQDGVKFVGGNFVDLLLAHRGKRICVMGGAPSLAEQIKDIDADIWISANEHGAKLRQVDYIVAMDDEHGGSHRNMREVLRECSDAPIIGPWPSNDVALAQWPGVPRKVLSGMVATWVAWSMGAGVVILAGMDGYNGKPSALRDARLIAQTIKNVRVVGGGPLADVWQVYDREEKFGPYKEPSTIRALLNVDDRIVIQVRKPTVIRGRAVAKGDELTVMRHEVSRLLHHRMVVEV